MNRKFLRLTSILFLIYGTYHFIADVIPQYETSAFILFNFSLWVNFIYYLSTFAFAVCFFIYAIKDIKNERFKKLMPIWLFINSVLSIGLNITAKYMIGDELFKFLNENPILAFMRYGIIFLIRYGLIFLAFWGLLQNNAKARLFKISAIFVIVGLAESHLMTLKNILNSQGFSPDFTFFLSLISSISNLALFILAVKLRNHKAREISLAFNIFLLIDSIYSISITAFSKASFFLSVPKYVYSKSIFEIVTGDYIFDGDLLKAIGFIIILILTINSIKQKRSQKMQKKHYLFDFDGTLVDSMPTWAGVHIKALQNSGIEVPDDFVETITPLGNYNASKYTISLGLDTPLEVYLENISRELYEEYTTRICLKANVAEALNELKLKNISLNVLTASPHLYVDPCLKRLGIYDLFENVWTIDDFSLTKAETAIYQKAAERLNADIAACTMIDDNYTAVSTAQKAGMNTIAVFDSTSKASEADLKALADKYIYDFKELI